MKTPLPSDIAESMRVWREGRSTWTIPVEYIEFHRSLALKDLSEFPDRGIRVHTSWMGDDGWCDGMNVIHAIIELSDESLKKIKWSDSNQGWMVRLPSGGWERVDLSPAETV